MTTRFLIIDRHPVSHTLLLVSFEELFQNPAIPLFFATLFCKSALEPLKKHVEDGCLFPEQQRNNRSLCK